MSSSFKPKKKDMVEAGKNRHRVRFPVPIGSSSWLHATLNVAFTTHVLIITPFFFAAFF